MAPDFENHFRFMGRNCRDRITGFCGVGASVCFDLYGCIQTCLTPAHNPNANEQQKSVWYDNNRLEVINSKLVLPLPEFMGAAKAKDAGGGFDKPGR